MFRGWAQPVKPVLGFSSFLFTSTSKTSTSMLEKPSFVLHKDSLVILEKMTDEQAGQFIKTLYHYQLTGEVLSVDFGIDMAVTPFINQFIRDNQKWQTEVKSKSDSGKLGNLKRWNKNIYDKVVSNEITLAEGIILSQDVAKDRTAINQVAKIAVNVNDSVSVNDNVKDNKKGIEERKQVFILHTQEINFKDNILDDFTLNDDSKGFIPYWTEHGDNDKKMRFEKEKSFNTKRRLCTWRDSALKFSQKNNNNNGQVSTADALSKLINGR